MTSDGDIEHLIRSHRLRTSAELDRRVLRDASHALRRPPRRVYLWAAGLAAAAAVAAAIGEKIRHRPDGSVAAGLETLGFMLPSSARDTAESAPFIYEVRPLRFVPSNEGPGSYEARVLSVIKGDPAAAGREIVMTVDRGDRVQRLGFGTMSFLSVEHWPPVPDDPEAGPAWLVPLRPAKPASDEGGRPRLQHAFETDFRATLVTAGGEIGEPGKTADAVLDLLKIELFASLDDPRPDVRSSAIHALQHWDGVDPDRLSEVGDSSLCRDEVQARRLLGATRDPDARVRWTATWMIPNGAGEVGEARLRGLLFDPERQVREAAAYVLRARGRSDLASGEEEIADYDLDQKASALGIDQWKTDSTESLCGLLLHHAQPEIRSMVAWRLGYREPSAAIATALILALSEDSSAEVRRGAAHSLGLSGGEGAIEALGDAAGIEDARVRAMAAWALGRLGDDRGVALLAALMRESDARAAAQGVDFLSDLGGDRVIAPLRDAAHDARPAVRAQALVALASLLGPERAAEMAPLLLEAAAEDSPYVRAAASAARERLERR